MSPETDELCGIGDLMVELRPISARPVPHRQSVSDMFTAVTLTYGFMETPDVIRGLQLCRKRGLSIDPAATSFLLSRRTLRPASRPEMRRWQEKLFIWLAGSAEDATAYFRIPPDRVVEIGTQVAI